MHLYVLLFIAGSIMTIHGLITKAGIRSKAYLRPGSRLNILRHLNIFLYFCAHFNLHDNSRHSLRIYRVLDPLL